MRRQPPLGPPLGSRRGLVGVLVTTLTPVLVSCSLVSCGGGASAVGGTAKIGTSDIGATPAQALRDGGTFRWALDFLPVNFNYNQLDGPELNNAHVIGGVLPHLWLAQPDGTVRMNGDYLVSAILRSTNPEVVTYTLRNEATWSDGTPITWRDFRAQWQALNGRNKAFQIASSTGYHDIASVERGASDKQAVVTFATPLSDWKTVFDPLYPASTNTDPHRFNTGWTQGFPVTAGPFKVARIDRTAKTITIVRDEKWWGHKPRLDRIIFRAIPGVAQFDALANNETDYVEVGADVNSFTRAQSTPGVTVRKALAPSYRHITFNGRPGNILADQQLRIALQKGINRKAITQAMIGRIVPGATPLGNHIYVHGELGYQDDSQVVGYDPAEASHLLDALGWTRQGEDIRRKNGRELVIRDMIPTEAPGADQEARQVQQFLAAIGVKVDITPVPTRQFFPRYLIPGNFDIAHFAWFSVPFPVTTSSSIYATGDGVQQNFGGVGNDTINNLFAQASREFDPARKIELAHQIDREIWQTGHSLLLYQRPDVWGVRAGIANIGAFGISDPIYTNIGFTR